MAQYTKDYLEGLNYQPKPEYLTMEDLENIAKKGNVGTES